MQFRTQSQPFAAQSTVSVVLMLLLAAVLSLGASGARGQDYDDGFSDPELDQLLAPIALYPDVLLSQVLMASTYPLEIVAAARWSRNNPGLDGEAAVDAVSNMDWDDSVKSLVAFPDLLARLDEDLDWTQQLGDAYLYQEEDVLGRVQALRNRAYAEGHLRDVERVRVVREQEVIYIEPAHPRIVYVPYYNPVVVYGSWPWHAYPPVYWAHPRVIYGTGRAHTGVVIYWGSPISVSPVFYYSHFDWHRRHIVIVNVNRHVHRRPYYGRHVVDGRRWQHDPRHRRNVSYSRRALEQRYRTPETRPRSRASGEWTRRSQVRERMAGASEHQSRRSPQSSGPSAQRHDDRNRPAMGSSSTERTERRSEQSGPRVRMAGSRPDRQDASTADRRAERSSTRSISGQTRGSAQPRTSTQSSSPRRSDGEASNRSRAEIRQRMSSGSRSQSASSGSESAPAATTQHRATSQRSNRPAQQSRGSQRSARPQSGASAPGGASRGGSGTSQSGGSSGASSSGGDSGSSARRGGGSRSDGIRQRMRGRDG